MKLQAEWQALSGRAIRVKQLSKKINNMETKIKKETDINKTGNKQIKLKSWEQAFWRLMDGDRNPHLSKIPSAVQVGVPSPIQTAVSVDGISSESHSSVIVVETATSSLSKKNKKACLPETSETQNLSTAELQRLVLLEQLS
ncbi:unnamed protein product [Acanthoscelides obtectus]|uniref:Uncharacterized protein n=1 Tax=Acanthoscelides obtectus TaxID=200917 RepID=A0A9P0JSS7_ACAOB|nr:unnamed protein product [Acanthoscelides obtectus]CAK1633922.1 hypothetical protein AOBTE_LOCUS8489 [Acanthoscelides obtectus]